MKRVICILSLIILYCIPIFGQCPWGIDCGGSSTIPDPTIGDPDSFTMTINGGRWIANAAGTATLPAATSQMGTIEVGVEGAVVAVIDANGTNAIYLNGTSCGAGGSVQSAGAGGEKAQFSYRSSGAIIADATGFICTP